jgi:enoyl-CoA hydratase/carnithine racemase
MAPQFTYQPPAIPDDVVQLSYPAPHVLHIAMNRPKAYNAMSSTLSMTLSDIFDWYEAEPSLWVAVLGSTNRKAWCAGADLKEWVRIRLEE